MPHATLLDISQAQRILVQAYQSCHERTIVPRKYAGALSATNTATVEALQPMPMPGGEFNQRPKAIRMRAGAPVAEDK
jgi:hypothetical protein